MNLSAYKSPDAGAKDVRAGGTVRPAAFSIASGPIAVRRVVLIKPWGDQNTTCLAAKRCVFVSLSRVRRHAFHGGPLPHTYRRTTVGTSEAGPDPLSGCVPRVCGQGRTRVLRRHIRQGYTTDLPNRAVPSMPIVCTRTYTGRVAHGGLRTLWPSHCGWDILAARQLSGASSRSACSLLSTVCIPPARSLSHALACCMRMLSAYSRCDELLYMLIRPNGSTYRF